MKESKIDAIVEQTTLKVFNLSTRPTNYKILKMLPSDIKSIEKAVGINKINTNHHVNELEAVGLVKRERGTGRVQATDLSINLIKLIEAVKSEVKRDIAEESHETPEYNSET